MIQSRRISSLLKIQPGEERLVGSLVSLYFVLALSYVFVQSMAFGLFITEYGPDFLPYSYLSIAVFATLLAYFYLKLSERVPFTRLVSLNLSFLALASFLLWLGLRSPLSHYFAFLLPLWFQVLLNLGNLVIWPLAGRLLDIQQGKRLFGLVGSGMWLANIIGGLLVPTIVSRIGAVDLLFLAVVSILASLFLLRRLLGKFHEPPAAASYPEPLNRGIRKSDRWLNQSYILLIFGYTFIWWVSFYFIDNIFYNRLAAQYPDADQLTAFMGALLSVMGIIAFITTTFLTSRLIGRFGLRFGLLAMPLLVTLGIGLLAVGGSLAAPVMLIFSLSVSVKLINVALGFSLSQSSNVVVYQSLSDRIRPRIQTTAEGIVQPIAIGSAGLVLLALTTWLGFGYIGLSYVFLALGAIWITVIVYLTRGYVPALMHTITRHRLGESRTSISDPAMISILRTHLDDLQPAAVLYSIVRLEEIEPQLLVESLPGLTRHPSAEVRRLAFSRIEQYSLSGALEDVLGQLQVESDPAARQAGLQALGAVSGSPVPEMLTSALRSSDSHSVHGALVGLLNYHFSPSMQAEFDRLLHSSLLSQRLVAARALEQLHQPHLDDAFIQLLHDPSPAVRRAALASAAASPRPALVDELLAACDSPHTNRLAASALACIGEPALEALQAAFSQPGSSRLRSLTLARSLGEIGGERSAAILLARLAAPDLDLRSQVLTSLCQCRYHTTDAAWIKSKIEGEIQVSVWICSLLAQPGFQDRHVLLSASLHQALLHASRRVLQLLSFLLDSSSILRAMDVLSSAAQYQSGYAIEIVVEQLPAGWKNFIVPLLEDLSPGERLSRLASVFPPPQLNLEAGLPALIAGTSSMQFSPWVRSCSIYSAALLSSHGSLTAIESALSDPDSLVAATASWGLSWLPAQDLLQMTSDGRQGKNLMLSIIEKVLILKTVGMFSQTPDDVLADVAGLLVEVDTGAGERIITQGEQGDSLFVIVDGKVRVHDNERLLNYLGEREVFGEMALLDPEPRMASVTAVEPSRLFRLDQGAFYQLVAERPEVSIGIIHVLTSRLRSLTRDTAQVNSSSIEKG